MGFSFDRNEGRRKGKNGGFYVAVGLCCAAVCLVALSSAVNNRKDNRSGGHILNESVITRQTAATTSTTASVYADEVTDDGLLHRNEDYSADVQEIETSAEPVEAPQTAEPENLSETGSASEETDIPEPAGQAVAVMSWSMPSDGGILSGFSNGELVYCSTMCDWRVHNGVDIACEPGGMVKAAANGTVYDFVEDALFGWTLITEQADGSMLYYCGLASTPLFAKGAEVKAGDVIGYLGEVPCESGDQSHLHLAMIKDGDFIDPASVISA